MPEPSHPSPKVIASYSTGELPLAPGLVVSAHLETCPACRERAIAIEDAEGRLLASLPDAPLQDDAFERVMDRIAERKKPRGGPPRRQLGDVPLPAAIAHVGLGPRRFVTPDFWVAPVRVARRGGWRAYLLRAPARAKIPSHLHRGPEFVCVLTGAFRDGRIYAAGDFAENPTNQEHELNVTSDGPCACLVATQGGAEWRGLARALSPLLGI